MCIRDRALGRPTYVKMMNPVASGEKAVREWLLWIVPPHVQEWVPFMTFFFFTSGLERVGELRKSQRQTTWASFQAPKGRWGMGCFWIGTIKRKAGLQLVPEWVEFAQ